MTGLCHSCVFSFLRQQSCTPLCMQTVRCPSYLQRGSLVAMQQMETEFSRFMLLRSVVCKCSSSKDKFLQYPLPLASNLSTHFTLATAIAGCQAMFAFIFLLFASLHPFPTRAALVLRQQLTFPPTNGPCRQNIGLVPLQCSDTTCLDIPTSGVCNIRSQSGAFQPSGCQMLNLISKAFPCAAVVTRV